MFRGNKKPAKKKETLLSCPFCGLAFEDVTLHLDTCSGVQNNQPKPSSAPTTPPPEPPSSKPLPEVPQLRTSDSHPTPPKPLPERPQSQSQLQPQLPPKPNQQTPAAEQPPSPPQPQLPPKPQKAQSTLPQLPPKPQLEHTGSSTQLPQLPPKPASITSLPIQEPSNNNNSPQTTPPLPDKTELRKSLLNTPQRDSESPLSSPRVISQSPRRMELPPKDDPAWTKPSVSSFNRSRKFLRREDGEEEVDKTNSDGVESENTDNEDAENEFDDDMARVIYDYSKENEGEIEVRSGDLVVVLDTSNPDWYFVRKDSETGYIASNYIVPINFTPQVQVENNENIANSEAKADVEEKKEEVVVMRNRKPTTPTPIKPSQNQNLRSSNKSAKPKFLSIKSFGIGGKKSSSSSMEFSISRNDSPQEFSISRNDNPADQNTGDAAAPSVDDKVDQRTKIAREILSTEQHYIRILKALEENYKQKLTDKISNESYGKGSEKVTLDNLRDIFANANMILPFNLQLLGELEKILGSWDENSVIGDIFVRMAPFLKMYNQYSNSYDNAMAVLAKCTKVEKFALLVEECDATTGLSARLDSLLIAPIQRIPRYTLLLSEMKKHTPEGHADQTHLDKAIPLLQEVADYINKNILQAENRAKLLSLSMAGAQSLLKPHRQLLHEGVLVEKKSKLHLWLFNDILVHITETKAKDKRNLNDPKNQWPLHLIWIEKKPKNNFSLVGPTARYLLSSQIPEEADRWLSNINSVCEQHFQYLSVTQDLDLQKEKDANMKAENMARYGTFEFPTGETFSGWWNDGKFDGQGKFSFFGSTYVGNFKDGLRDGFGEFTYNNGSIYEGDWANDKPNGSGTLRYPNGDVYIGPWRDGKRSGKGEFRAIAGDSYIGEWAEDVPEGLGEMYYRNGDVYNGNWHAGLRSHYGILINKDGTRYEGEWVAGVKHGKGRMEFAENYYYNGYWKEGMYYGQGKLVTPGGTYDGEWVADLKEGFGTYTYPNGCVYKGQWKKNLYHGNGTFTHSAGIVESYTGEFANHRKNGSGVLKYFNGDIYEGHFKENMFHGTGTFTWADGSYLKSKWSRGKPGGESTFGKGKEKSSIIHGVLKDGILQIEGRPNIYLPNLPPISMDM